MIRAGIVPYAASGFYGVVVVDDALRFVAKRSAEVGHLVPLAVPFQRGNKTFDKVREITAEEAATCAYNIVRLVKREGATRVTIERSSGRSVVAQRAARMIESIVSRLDSDVAVEFAPGPPGGYSRHVRPEDLAAIAGWPEKSYDVERRAAAILIPGGLAGLGAPEDARQTSVAGATPEAVTEHRAVPSTPLPLAVPPKQGPRTMGVDPGAAWTGLVIGEGAVAPLRCVLARTLEFGRVIERKGKSIRKTEHSFTDEDVDAHADEIVALAKLYDVDRVVLERIVYGRPNDDPTGIARAQWIGGEVRRALTEKGFPVETVAVTTWRAKVAGRASGNRGGSGAERIPLAVTSGFTNWPGVTDTHIRDAGGLTLYGVASVVDAPVPATKAKIKRGIRKDRREYDKEYEEERARKNREARTAAGCTCKRNHRAKCPLYRPKVVKT